MRRDGGHVVDWFYDGLARLSPPNFFLAAGYTAVTSQHRQGLSMMQENILLSERRSERQWKTERSERGGREREKERREMRAISFPTPSHIETQTHLYGTRNLGADVIGLLVYLSCKICECTSIQMYIWTYIPHNKHAYVFTEVYTNIFEHRLCPFLSHAYTHTGMPARNTCVTNVPAVMSSLPVQSSDRVKFAPLFTWNSRGSQDNEK